MTADSWDTQIIELELEKDILDPHIIIEGENIQLQMKKKRPTYVKDVYSSDTKNNTAEVTELCTNYTEGKNAQL